MNKYKTLKKSSVEKKLASLEAKHERAEEKRRKAYEVLCQAEQRYIALEDAESTVRNKAAALRGHLDIMRQRGEDTLRVVVW